MGSLISSVYTGYIGYTGGDPITMSIMFFDPKSNLRI